MNREIFDPVLVTPNPLAVSDEQKDLIRSVLDVSSSDSRFALKAYIAIMKILLNESLVPVITSIDPTEGHIPDTVEVTITGENFEAASVVLQAGAPILSSFVNETTLTASVLLSGAAVGVLAISVRNSTMLTSNVVNFDVLAALPLTEVANQESGIKVEPSALVLPTAVVATTEEVPVVSTEGTDLDELRARIASMNAAEQTTPNTQFDSEQSGGAPLEGAK